MKVTFTLAAEAADSRDVTVQIKQDRQLNRNIGSPRVIQAYLSSDAAGLATESAEGDVSLYPVEESQFVDSNTAHSATVVTDADGTVVLNVSTTTDVARTTYLNIVDPATGKVHTSGAVAFIDNP